MPIILECVVNGANVGKKDGELYCFLRDRKITSLFTCALCGLDAPDSGRPYHLSYR